ncbi:SCO family protein [Asticcacaulis benevestitus]|uniref:Thioredoxin domain-containing protein n=1 Tax=Asticcacaulis benevestitus DSM 16100 = ATCC BAA-896 TaxID=1121022 RepID=V4RQ81_9CAUL|nr:SCO family protein [Asticcacaulis benevestitus]ESQ93383.1 hypothetical protein ABENE_05640 [Asticcacaulis benevestitus DSM 16100 = ATCC BAA-896]
MTKFRLAIIATAFALLIGLAGYNWYSSLHPRSNVTTSQVDPAVRIGGNFTLTDQDGKAVDQTILNGKWTAVFFGYTYCPDVCPLTLQSLARTKAALEKSIGGKNADKLQIVFITVDPARDTPANMKAYLASGGFPPGVIGLTGTPEQITAVERAYRISAAKVGEGDTYTYNHTSLVYLMDPQGHFHSPLMSDLTPQQSAEQITDAMKGR